MDFRRMIKCNLNLLYLLVNIGKSCIQFRIHGIFQFHLFLFSKIIYSYYFYMISVFLICSSLQD